MSQVTNTPQTSSITFGSVTEGARSPQLALALLQMELAKANKNEALSNIDEIQKQQNQKKECADMLNLAREMQSQNVNGSMKPEEFQHLTDVCKEYRDRGWASLPDIDKDLSTFGLKGPEYGNVQAAIKKWDTVISQLEAKQKTNDDMYKLTTYCQSLGISMPTSGDKDTNKTQWDKVISQLQTKMDTFGADIQTKMVQLQDMMGQYNSYMQGANSAISTSNQVLTSLAKGQ